MKFSSSSINSLDNSFDVTDKLNKSSKQFEIDKSSKVYNLKSIVLVEHSPQKI